MSIEIRPVETKKDLKTFVKFPFGLYKDNPYWVPQLIAEEMDMFNPKKNPAYETADTRLYLAYKDGQPAGRIAVILSHIANKKWDTKNIRFGWFDAIDDYDVAKALLDKVVEWGKETGMETMTGPHGFTDMEPEGMLVEGYDQLATIAVYYNHPYYNTLVEKYGLEKEIDYMEFRAEPPEDGVPSKLLKLGARIKERSSLKVVKFNKKKEIMARAEDVFDLLDEAYEEIYGAVPLSREQIRYYTKRYFPFIDKDLLQLVVNDKDEVVGFMIAMPSLSKGLQKAKGKLFPFGWYHIMKALKTYDILDFYLAGVKKEYRGQGVDLMMVLNVAEAAIKKGFTSTESNPELETNKKIQAQWKYFNPTQHKRRRIYKKNIG